MNIDKPIKDITTIDGITTILFNDDTSMQLEGKPFEIQMDMALNRCILCGRPAGKYPLYSRDNKIFLCRDCVKDAYNTFLEHDISMEDNENEFKQNNSDN